MNYLEILEKRLNEYLPIVEKYHDNIVVRHSINGFEKMRLRSDIHNCKEAIADQDFERMLKSLEKLVMLCTQFNNR